MTYFNLRKREPEPELDEGEEAETSAEDQADEEPPAARPYGPVLVGIRGPALWLSARFGPGTSLAVHVGAGWGIVYYGGWTAVVIITGWLTAVALFIPRDYLDHLADRIENRATAGTPDVDDEPPAETAPEPLVALLWRLIADAPGVHLKTLTACLQETSPAPLDKAAVTARLATLGIPVRPSVRDARKKINTGVHRDDLQAWEDARSPTAPRTPPEPRSPRVATALTCDVANTEKSVATPLSRLRALLARGDR
ncbi:hypothetical protein ABZX85_23295 [Streptomyces sp. NPDC004539]|uniref:hypothetical protein n=1 Tax=Streptomyces sp. NPDC004539 TaxID=3154280 RepID=UPI0033A26BFA